MFKPRRSKFSWLTISIHSIHQKVENVKVLSHNFDLKQTPITATFIIKTLNNSIGKLPNPSKTCKWDSQDSIIFSCLIEMNLRWKQACTQALERNKSVQNLQKITKVFTEFISCSKASKKRNQPWHNEICANLKRNWNSLLVFYKKIWKT